MMILEREEAEATHTFIDDEDAESDCESLDDEERMGTALRTALNDAKLLKRRLGMRRLHSIKQMGTGEVDIPVIAWFRHPCRGSTDQPAHLPESLAYYEPPELDDDDHFTITSTQFAITTTTPGKTLGKRGSTRSSGIWHPQQERRRSSIIMMDESSRREFAAITA